MAAPVRERASHEVSYCKEGGEHVAVCETCGEVGRAERKIETQSQAVAHVMAARGIKARRA